jgi:hypothetical protein
MDIFSFNILFSINKSISLPKSIGIGLKDLPPDVKWVETQPDLDDRVVLPAEPDEDDTENKDGVRYI